jgi:hypothetical protein
MIMAEGDVKKRKLDLEILSTLITKKKKTSKIYFLYQKKTRVKK